MASDGGGSKPGGFSLSLGGAGAKRGGASRPRAVPGADEGRRDGPVREEVTGFGADGGLQTAAPAAAKAGPLSIPKQENSYR